MEPIRTILVPVDLDSPSQAAIEAALPLAKTLNARIVLLHVVPFVLSDVPHDLFYASPNTSVRNRTQWLRALGELAETHRDYGVHLHTELREGIVWDEIIGLARQIPAELIVIGTHARHGIARGLLGSVAERVVRASPIPVMTVRANLAEGARTEFATR